MTGYKKNTWLAVIALAMGFAAFPFSYSEAQSTDVSLSALECEEVAYSSLTQMNGRQQDFSKQCDIVEASHDWEEQYGSLNEQELVLLSCFCPDLNETGLVSKENHNRKDGMKLLKSERVLLKTVFLELHKLNIKQRFSFC